VTLSFALTVGFFSHDASRAQGELPAPAVSAQGGQGGFET
jgi:hypothetical protein